MAEIKIKEGSMSIEYWRNDQVCVAVLKLPGEPYPRGQRIDVRTYRGGSHNPNDQGDVEA